MGRVQPERRKTEEAHSLAFLLIYAQFLLVEQSSFQHQSRELTVIGRSHGMLPPFWRASCLSFNVRTREVCSKLIGYLLLQELLLLLGSLDFLLQFFQTFPFAHPFSASSPSRAFPGVNASSPILPTSGSTRHLYTIPIFKRHLQGDDHCSI